MWISGSAQGQGCACPPVTLAPQAAELRLLLLLAGEPDGCLGNGKGMTVQVMGPAMPLHDALEATGYTYRDGIQKVLLGTAPGRPTDNSAYVNPLSANFDLGTRNSVQNEHAVGERKCRTYLQHKILSPTYNANTSNL